jgi:hypothetical protein
VVATDQRVHQLAGLNIVVIKHGFRST